MRARILYGIGRELLLCHPDTGAIVGAVCWEGGRLSDLRQAVDLRQHDKMIELFCQLACSNKVSHVLGYLRLLPLEDESHGVLTMISPHVYQADIRFPRSDLDSESVQIVCDREQVYQYLKMILQREEEMEAVKKRQFYYHGHWLLGQQIHERELVFIQKSIIDDPKQVISSRIVVLDDPASYSALNHHDGQITISCDVLVLNLSEVARYEYVKWYVKCVVFQVDTFNTSSTDILEYICEDCECVILVGDVCDVPDSIRSRAIQVPDICRESRLLWSDKKICVTGRQYYWNNVGDGDDFNTTYQFAGLMIVLTSGKRAKSAQA